MAEILGIIIGAILIGVIGLVGLVNFGATIIGLLLGFRDKK